MKKTYMSPETSLLLIITHNMIATSNPEGFKSQLDEDDKITDPNNMLSRRHTVWDEEEEEEEF